MSEEVKPRKTRARRKPQAKPAVEEKALNEEQPTSDPQPKPEEPEVGGVELAKLVDAVESESSYKGVAVVGEALRREGVLSDEHSGDVADAEFKAAFGAWQRRCGWRGPRANGVPTRSALQVLGRRYGFDIS